MNGRPLFAPAASSGHHPGQDTGAHLLAQLGVRRDTATKAQPLKWPDLECSLWKTRVPLACAILSQTAIHQIYPRELGSDTGVDTTATSAMNTRLPVSVMRCGLKFQGKSLIRYTEDTECERPTQFESPSDDDGTHRLDISSQFHHVAVSTHPSSPISRRHAQPLTRAPDQSSPQRPCSSLITKGSGHEPASPLGPEYYTHPVNEWEPDCDADTETGTNLSEIHEAFTAIDVREVKTVDEHGAATTRIETVEKTVVPAGSHADESSKRAAERGKMDVRDV